MLLQCETHDGACGEGWGLAERWLHPETLESLVELNELCLGLFAEQAAVRCAQPSLLLRQVGELWRVLDAAARRRAAARPYLLVGAGFAHPHRRRQPALADACAGVARAAAGGGVGRGAGARARAPARTDAAGGGRPRLAARALRCRRARAVSRAAARLISRAGTAWTEPSPRYRARHSPSTTGRLSRRSDRASSPGRDRAPCSI